MCIFTTSNDDHNGGKCRIRFSQLSLQKTGGKTHESLKGPSFTWYIYGPYSSDLTRDGYSFVNNRPVISDDVYNPLPNEETILMRMKMARRLFNDSDKAELVWQEY